MANEISPTSLIADNRSSYSRGETHAWYEARKKNKLMAVKFCSDARGLIVPDLTYLIKEIAVGNNWVPYGRLLQGESVLGVMSLGHYDADVLDKEGYPGGCGGLSLKANIKNGSFNGEIIDVARYAQSRIVHEDLLRQVIASAQEAGEVLGQSDSSKNKPVLASVQNHLSGVIYPVAVVTEGGRVTTTEFPQSYMHRESYDFRRLYKKGVPVLSDYRIPNEFTQYLDENRRQVARLHEAHPNFRQMQKVQNPEVILVSTAVKPPQTRYSSTFSRPGSVFLVSLAREEVHETWSVVPEGVFQDAIDQVHYPTSQSIENFGNSDKPFSATNTLFIETHDLEYSRQLAQRLVREKGWMKAWRSLPGKQVLIGMMRGGYAHAIQQFSPEPSVFPLH